uniref:flagellar hook-length control protein FliK n=1 Tax=uncultured Paenalcaligenes sp. TaxID=1588925 RepID=UPI00261EC44E
IQSNTKPLSFLNTNTQDNTKPLPTLNAEIQSNTKPLSFLNTNTQDNTKPLPTLNAEIQSNTKPLSFLNAENPKSGAVRVNLAIDSLSQNNGLAPKNKDQAAQRVELLTEQLSLKQTTVPLTQTTATPEFSLQNLTQSALQVSSLPAAPLAASHSLQITTPVQQTAQWGADFSRVMVQLGQQGAQNPGLQTAEIRLDPPELGPLRIVLSVTESVANAMIFAAHAQTRLTVEQALPQLQQQLAQAGLSLGEANVSDQGFSAQSEQHADKNPNKPATFSLTGTNQSDDNSGLLASATDTQRVDSNAIIDTFA